MSETTAMKPHTSHRELVAKLTEGRTLGPAAAAPVGGPESTEDMLERFKLRGSTSVLADIGHPIMPLSLRGSLNREPPLRSFAAANDNRKVGDGFIRFVAFVIFTEIAATLLLTLPNWY
jgi:hypothetical protein